MQLPHSVKAGLMYQNPTFMAAVEYEFQAWGGGNQGRFEESITNNMKVQYVDTHTAKVGFSYTPNRFDVRNYFNRVAYRAGVRLSNYYQTFGGERLNNIAITAGLGLPLKIWGISTVNIGFEYGRMSQKNPIEFGGRTVGLVTQNSFKLTLGFSLFSADTADYWFVQQKYD
jgi:hypothetical protein